ncbi:hypothetical protein V5799_016708 [Amblyomma americanum]|uniref:Uncharacterized protein n=1 Tax=Amblyomma americanum TaxID=6943 RepID=A0AAQ4F4A0_AMBAM
MNAPVTEPQHTVATKRRDDSKKRTDNFVIGVVLGGGLLAIMLLVAEELLSRREEKQVGFSDFCCPDEARMLLEDVNVSVDPCWSFYGHVCVVKPHGSVRSRAPLELDDLKIEWGVVEKLPDVANTPIGLTLWELGQSCSNQDWSLQSALPEFTSAVLAAANLSRSYTPLENLTSIFRFMAVIEFRFNSPVAVSMRDDKLDVPHNASALTLRWRGVSVKERATACKACLTAVLEALKNGSEVNETLTRLEALELPPPDYDEDEDTEQISLEDIPFSGLEGVAWRAILRDLIRPIYPNAGVLRRKRDGKIDKALGHLAANATIGSLYVIQHTVTELYTYTEHSSIYDALRDKRWCTAKTWKLSAMEEAFRAQVVSSAGTADHLEHVFARIKGAVKAKVFSGSLFAGERDVSSAVNLLNQFALELPDVDGVVDRPPPRMTYSFPWNLLFSRSFDFDITRLRTARRLHEVQSDLASPDVTRRGLKIVAYAGAYADLRMWKKDTRLMDLPVVAASMAKELWSVLFESSSLWSNKTVQNILDLYDCIHRTHDGASTGIGMSVGEVDHRGLVEWAAALATVVEAVDTVKWSREGLLAANTPISEGRLFYIKWASSECNAQLPNGLITADSFDAQLRHMADFAARFGCPVGSPMRQRTCV